MSKKIKIQFIALSLLFSGTLQAIRFDSSSLKAIGVSDRRSSEIENYKKKQRNSNKSSKIKLGDYSDLISLNETEIQNTIRSLNTLIQKNRGALKARLLINRSKSYSSLAKKKILNNPKAVESAMVQDYLKRAKNDALSILRLQGIGAASKAKAYYYAGVSNIYTREDSGKYFLNSIQLNPRSAEAPWMMLIYAEELFDAEKFQESIKIYRSYFKGFSREQKIHARYKMAWAYTNVGQLDAAIKSFQWVLKADNSNYGKDAVRDLASVLATVKKDSEIVSIAKKYFSTNRAHYKEFLRFAYLTKESKGAFNFSSVLFKELLKVTSDPTEKIELSFSALRGSRRPYASRQYQAVFSQFFNQLRKTKSQARSQFLKDYSSDFDLEAQNFIKGHVDTYAGRVLSPEKLTKNEIVSNIDWMTSIYLNSFKASKQRKDILQICFDVCADQKNMKCLSRVKNLALKHSDMRHFHEKAAYEEISILEKYSKSQPKKYSSYLIKSIRSFVEKHPKSKDRLKMSQRLVSLYEVKKDFPSALAIQKKVYPLSRNIDDLQKIQFLRFKLGKYSEIVADKNLSASALQDQRIRELYRESTLKLALNAKKKGDDKAYSAQVLKFINLSRDQKKILSAKTDLINYNLKKKNYKNALQLYMSLKVPEKSDPSTSNLRSLLWTYLVDSGNWKASHDMLQGIASQDKIFHYQKNVSSLLVTGRLKPQSLQFVDPESQQYFRALSSVYAPRDFLSQRSNLKNKDNLVNAIRSLNGSLLIQKTERNIAFLGRDYPFASDSLKAEGYLASESSYRALSFPQASQGIDVYSQSIAALLPQVRSLRNSIVQEIQGKKILTQLRAVTTAKQIEEKTAQAFVNSPRPRGLASTELSQYDQGIKQAAAEFLQNASEFAKLETQLKERYRNEKTQAKEEILPNPRLSKAKLSSSFKKSKFAKILFNKKKSSKVISQIVFLDYLKNTRKISSADYQRAKLNIVFKKRNDNFIKHYLKKEMETNGQMALSAKVFKK